MRGDKREGRFSIDFERASNISGTTKELIHTVGTSVEWYIYDKVASLIDPIYDVGADGEDGGRIWKPALTIPVVQGHLEQGVTLHDDRGFYNTDVLNITINVDVLENSVNLYGAVAENLRKLSTIDNYPDLYLRDRIVYRSEVFSPVKVGLHGLIKEKYTLVTIQAHQVNSEEMVNDSQFQQFANYNPFNL
jgi:hypothetical protein